LAVLQNTALACNLPAILTGEGKSDVMEHAELDSLIAEAGISLDEVMATPAVDERPETLKLLGAPDAFTLQWQELQGQTVRWEEWSYFDHESRFDFVDGELLWTLEIDPAPSGSIYAHAFNPLDFEAGMSMAEVQAILPDIAMAQVPLDEADIPGGVLLAGDQILLGFDQDQLVYLQTFIVNPDPPLELEGETVESAAPTAALPASTQPPGLLLRDTFDSAAQSAVPFYGPDYMEFSVDDGVGVLTAHHSGVLVAKYDAPLVQDFAATLVLWPPNPQPGAGYGMLFRGQADAGGIPDYYLLFAYPADGTLRLQRWEGNDVRELAAKPLPDTKNAPFTLHVEVAGNTIYAEVNETPVLLAEDDSLMKPGILGLTIYSRTDGDHVLFDELKVEALGD
jgi:hypothetical protein